MGSISRRRFLHTASALALSTAGCHSLKKNTVEKNTATHPRPNILLILVDDLGWGDLSGYGADDLQTPHIDRLCRSGMKFIHAYANCPVCSPTRAALLSGRYQEFVGVPGVIRTHHNNSWGHLTPDSRLLPQRLQPQGYQTALIGKWHLGLQSPNTPNQRGFEYFHGFLGDMMDDYYTHLRHDINYMRFNEQTIDPKGHATDLFTQWACDYLRDVNRESPFFLYLSYNAPHTPVQPPPEWVKRFKRRNPDADDARAELGAFIEHLDHGIGTVMDCLDETGLDENTMVIFASDNGGLLRVKANNGPYRDGKGSVYEGGIRVPMCICWKDRIQPGSESDRIVLSMDIMPTVMQAAGAAVQDKIEGVSFYPTLLGNEEKPVERDLFFGRKEGGAFQGGRIEAIRRGDWKLLRPMPNQALELYYLKDDPYETQDLAQAHPERFAELKQALDRQLEAYSKVPWQPPR